MGCSQVKSTSNGGLATASQNNLQIKCVLLGDAAVGKSSVTGRYLRNQFNDVYDVTFGGVYNKKEVALKSGEKAFLHVWDTGGEERYRAMAPLYYRDAALALLVCSVDSTASLESLRYWMEELEEKRTKDSMIIVVAANKCDLQQRQFSKEQGERWAKNHGVEYREVSAKTGQGVMELFQLLINSYTTKKQ